MQVSRTDPLWATGLTFRNSNCDTRSSEVWRFQKTCLDSEQHDVVLLLGHRAFTLQGNGFAYEVRKTGQVLALLVQKELYHLW